jgi:hypothetical protein
VPNAQDSKPKEADTQSKAPAPTSPVDEAAATPQHTKEPEEQDHKSIGEQSIIRLTRALVWWTAILAAATIALCFVAVLQFVELRSTDKSIGRQAKTAQDQLGVIQRQLGLMETDQRPWIHIVGAKPSSELHFTPTGAAIIIEFEMKNVGRTPGRYATIEGQFLTRTVGVRDPSTWWKPCEDLQKKPVGELVAGMTLFPGEGRPLRKQFAWSKESISLFNSSTTDTAPMIFGCVDYVFAETHRQTRFAYELDGLSPDKRFLRIDTANGDIPAAGLVLAVNPALSGDAY